MRYRAVAIASERSNAVGAVELECSVHGLFITYVEVGAFSSGYAPGAVTAGTGLTIPWDAVSDARLEGDQFYLVVDHKLTPLNKLLLTRFSTGKSIPPEELAKRRLLVRFGSVASALVAALLIGAWVFRSSAESGAGAAIGLALLGAGLLLGLGFAVDQGLSNATDEQATLASFSIEVGQYLPRLVRSPRPAPKERAIPDISELQGLLPRTTFAIVITLTAGTLGVLLVARWVTTNQRAVNEVTSRMLEPAAPPPRRVAPPPRSEPQPSAPTAETQTSTAPAPSGDAVTVTGDCSCDRADSALWVAPIPRLSVLTLGQRIRLSNHADPARRRKHLELDVAVVNNSSKELEEVALMVLFYEREPGSGSRRSQVSNRSLFFEGPLLPGQAIKWSVEAEGSEFEIQNPTTGDIGPNGEDAAPASRIAELLAARNRPVRLHGAMLLAFLNDPRAKDGVLALREALREDEAPYLMRLVQALSDVRVCQLKVNPSGNRAQVSACVHNKSKEAKRDQGIALRGLEQPVSVARPEAEPPTVLVEKRLKIPGELTPALGKGVRFALDLEGKTPQVFEAYADRFDLLQ